jgi:hypothetical protein
MKKALIHIIFWALCLLSIVFIVKVIKFSYTYLPLWWDVLVDVISILCVVVVVDNVTKKLDEL